MKLDYIQVTNFRCFESLEVDFHPSLTVLVATNGVGKTAIIEAVATGLGVFLSQLPNVSGKTPKDTDFLLADDGSKPPYMRVVLKTVDGIAWDRTERRDKSKRTVNSIPKGLGYKEISEYANLIFNEWLNLTKPLPLVAYYGTGRAVFDTPQKRRNFQKEFNINDAYRGALDATPDFRRFFEYFYFLEDLERRKKEEHRDWDFRLPELETIREAITRMMPEFSNPHSKIRPLRFMVEWRHDNRTQTLRIDQLSDGFRTTLAMIMDIAARLAELNPVGKAALDSTGIVLIDEIDLHLHPSWQQRILPDLVRTFPNIQFIVTTHSPQVLTTVNRENIRLLGRDAGGLWRASRPTREIKGLESAVALIEAMHVNPVPPVEEADWMADYTAKIETGTHQDADGLALRQKLVTLYGVNHPIILDADRLIRFQEFKLRKKAKSLE